jgi:Na+-transporting methylmalonyl-CoA/oxaloacetate decarboxylase gamma subunit
VSVIDSLIADLSKLCAGLPDRRKGPAGPGAYAMSDIGLAAFSVFFMGSPSFLASQTALAAGQGRSNCQTLFGMGKIPTDNYIRLMLDGASPAAFDGLFGQAIAAAGPMEPFQCLGGRRLIALDGTEHFNSRKIHCAQCLTRKRADGGTEYYHSFLGATLVAPGHAQVMPLPPEFIVPQDGAEKQDCERNAAKRWLARHGPGLAHLRPVYLGDDLFACQPIAEAIQQAGGSFILTCKPSSHKTIEEYLYGAKLEEHCQTAVKRGRRTTTVYRWLAGVPLRATADALKVNWFSAEILNDKGKRTYHNSFVTDLEVTDATVAGLAACGRARWKIENETFNVLKTGGYNLEHNFGHGKKTLASVLVVLNLLAFAIHAAARLAVRAWKAAMETAGAVYRFFEHLRIVTAYVVFQNWDHVLRSIAEATIRPP